ncbi:hypothetical protein MXB_5591 [Myxobolus squamalis]|nr:hypothetical protein MXB_5591 [Myxobolus squamalis]
MPRWETRFFSPFRVV